MLVSIPGIGRITAGHLLARIGDWRLIRNSKQVPAFLGLVPSENSTGDDTRRGSLTKSGDGRLRNKRVQSAWMAIKHDPELAAFYKTVYDRNPQNHGAGKAITAVARKLAMRVAAVLKNQKPYEVKTDSLANTEETLRPRE